MLKSGINIRVSNNMGEKSDPAFFDAWLSDGKSARVILKKTMRVKIVDAERIIIDE